MADRDISIPMGPDRTGEIELPPIDFGDAGAQDDHPADPLAEPAYPSHVTRGQAPCHI